MTTSSPRNSGCCSSSGSQVDRRTDLQRAPRRDAEAELARALAGEAVEAVPLGREPGWVVGHRAGGRAVHRETGDVEAAAAELGDAVELPEQTFLGDRLSGPPPGRHRPVARIGILGKGTSQLGGICVGDRPVHQGRGENSSDSFLSREERRSGQVRDRLGDRGVRRLDPLVRVLDETEVGEPVQCRSSTGES